MSEQPQRIQRKRAKGWRMPPNTKYVGRGSFWGNPFVIGKDGTREEVIEKYKEHLKHHPCNYLIFELTGFDLACWCKIGEPCHADILLKIANEAAAEIDPAASE